MNYEEKYKEALERARKLYETCDSQAVVGWCEYIFPELKESEDERIRKSLIHLVHLYGGEFGMIDANTSVEKAIAWLEKQGEQKLANSCKTCKDEPFDYENATIIQKDFVPKVEAKFKVGDFIVNDYCMGKIVEITNDAYLLDTEQGIPFSCHSTRLWDITKDAKDGDVLIASDESLFIFARVKDNAAYYHYSLCKNGSQEISDGKHSWEVAKACHPATKEQRDLLFQKMKESGYEWNAENKEVKKISQRIISAEAKEAMYDKPAWSEEDEEHYNACLNYFEEIKPDSVYYKDYLWLKSLKERIEKQ